MAEEFFLGAAWLSHATYVKVLLLSWNSRTSAKLKFRTLKLSKKYGKLTAVQLYLQTDPPVLEWLNHNSETEFYFILFFFRSQIFLKGIRYSFMADPVSSSIKPLSLSIFFVFNCAPTVAQISDSSIKARFREEGTFVKICRVTPSLAGPLRKEDWKIIGVTVME